MKKQAAKSSTREKWTVWEVKGVLKQKYKSHRHRSFLLTQVISDLVGEPYALPWELLTLKQHGSSL
jgi:hypothetical protein